MLCIVGVVRFPDEKVRYEVATMRHVAANTTIPVPHIYHHGTAAENPTGLGPFIIMDYIEHHDNMARALGDPKRPKDQRPLLDPMVDEEKLSLLYGQMANILLQLSTLRFPQIGSLVEETSEGPQSSVRVGGRPLTANMMDILVHTNTAEELLPSRTYTTGHEWYSDLADMHMTQLALQQNDAVEDEDDARDKYVARQLFRNLAAEKRLGPELSDAKKEFILFSEDFRPANVLLDKDLRVVGVIDWEFAYAAPAQCSYDPPWWLLIEDPESWDGRYPEWTKLYEPRLQTFLRTMEAEEKKLVDALLVDKIDRLSLTGTVKKEVSLSQRMRDSWDKGTWLLNYAARKSWAFDFVWWKYLDERYFGPNEDKDYHARVKELSNVQRETMVLFVARKMMESRDPKIVEWEVAEAKILVAKVLI